MRGKERARPIVSICLPQFPMQRWRQAQALTGNAASGDLPQGVEIEGWQGALVHTTANVGCMT